MVESEEVAELVHQRGEQEFWRPRLTGRVDVELDETATGIRDNGLGEVCDDHRSLGYCPGVMTKCSPGGQRRLGGCGDRGARER